MATVAGEHSGVDDAVALLDRIVVVVGVDAVTKIFDDARALVSHDAPSLRERRVLLRLVTPPRMQVGPADASLGHAQQNCPRLWFGTSYS